MPQACGFGACMVRHTACHTETLSAVVDEAERDLRELVNLVCHAERKNAFGHFGEYVVQRIERNGRGITT